MNIDGLNKVPTSPTGVRPLPAKTSTEQAAKAAEVNLSSLASSMQTGEKPPVNTARIQEIKDAIAHGKFKINSEAIADRLIETARDLVKGQRQA